MAAEKILFARRWYGGMISTNLEVIWEMSVQASGRSQARRNLLKAEQEHGPEFLRLANTLSTLYLRGSEEKRLLDAMLLAVPR